MARIVLKEDWELEIMHEAGKLAWKCLQHLKKLVRPGLSAAVLDKEVEIFLRDHGAIPTFKNYRGFPCNFCFCLNDEIVHGIPDPRKIIKGGDIVKLDVGATYKGYVGDAAISMIAGEGSPTARKLVEVAEKALYAAISAMRPYGKLSDVSKAIQDCVESHGFNVVKLFVGHGVGSKMHEEPQILNYVHPRYKEVILKPGIVLAPEPMVNEGTSDVEVLEDNWTVVTADGKLSAHFEHTIAITRNGTRILTLPDE